MTRRTLRTFGLIVLSCIAAATTGCTVCQKGTLPEISLLALTSRAPKPSLAYAVSFLPPDPERNAARRDEFVQQLAESEIFEELRPQPADADVTLAVELVDVNLSSGKTLTTYLWTGGLWPVSVPYRYELKATARHATGRQQDYTITDGSSCRVWSPGLLQHSLGDLVEPRASRIRKNLYRSSNRGAPAGFSRARTVAKAGTPSRSGCP